MICVITLAHSPAIPYCHSLLTLTTLELITKEIDFDEVNYFCEVFETNPVKYIVYSFRTYFTTVDHRRLKIERSN